jgi:hypothetical protein
MGAHPSAFRDVPPHGDHAPMILGIDIGVQGAIAILSPEGELVEIHAMPCLHDGPKGRRTVNGPLLANIIFGAGCGALVWGDQFPIVF